MTRTFMTGVLSAALSVGAAAGYDVKALPGDEGAVVAAAPLRTEPGPGAGELVVTLQPGERVNVWAFTYVTERTRTPDGRGGVTVTEEYRMWYRLRTPAGYEGWVAASALEYPAAE